MPSRKRQIAPFRPLSRLPKPETAAAQQERQLRELEAEETAQDALRFARDIRRRQALEGAAAHQGDPHHAGPAGQDHEGLWEDEMDQLPADILEDVNSPPADLEAGLADDPILFGLHEQAKQIKRKKLLDNWQAQYDSLFDAYLKAKHLTTDWSTQEWSKDYKPACHCGIELI